MTAAEAAVEIAALFARLKAEGILVSHHWDSCLLLHQSDGRLDRETSVDFDDSSAASGTWTAHQRDADGDFLALDVEQEAWVHTDAIGDR